MFATAAEKGLRIQVISTDESLFDAVPMTAAAV
jgi:hypothetical protein